MTKCADVVVIGGGLIGTAVFYTLAKAGVKVILAEAKDVASGTSSHCDGNVFVSDKMPGYDAYLAKRSQDLYPIVASEIDYDFEWSREGSLLVMENDREMAAAVKYCKGLGDCGIPIRMLNEREIHMEEPNLADSVIGAIDTLCDGSVYPPGLCYALVHGAKQLGAEVMTHTKVIGIDRGANGQIEKVRTTNGDILTNTVVNAAGIWAKEVGAMVGLTIPIEPRQGQILVAEQTFQVARRKVVEFGYLMAKFQGGDYKRDVDEDIEAYGVAMVFEPTHHNNFLIGSSRRFVGWDTNCDFNVIRALAKRAQHFFPVLKDIKIIRTYAGLRPYTPDHFPIVSDTEVPGFYISAGHEGDGVSLALVTGEIITRMIRNEKQEIDIEKLSFKRYC